MEKIRIENLGGGKVYFTEADIASQRLYAVNRENLFLKLKLWLLLSDHIMLAGSHIFKSGLTAAILRECPELLESGALVPDLRDECRDFTDYVELKKDERDAGFLSQEARNLMEFADFLNEHSNKVVLWTSSPVTEAWRESLLKDLSDKDSTLRRKLVGVGTSSLKKLSQELSSRKILSRDAIAEMAIKCLGIKKNVFIKYANLLYYMFGAAHLESEPVLHKEAFEWGADRLMLSTRRLVRSDELPLFRSVLDEFGISDSVLQRLPISELLEVRKEAVAVKFRKKWYDIVKRAKSNQSFTGLGEVKETQDDLLEVIHEALGEERKKKTGYMKARGLLMIGSVITSVITTIVTNPVWGLGGLFIQLASIDPVLEVVERILGGTEISLFCTRLQKNL